MFRYQDDNNYYRYSIDAERFCRRLIKKVNGVITVLAEDIEENSYSPGRWYNMKVIAVGDNIKIYSDGELVYDVVDHSLLNGKIAMYTWADQGVSFDEILVTGLGKLTITATSPPDGYVGYPLVSGLERLALQDHLLDVRYACGAFAADEGGARCRMPSRCG